MVFGKIILHGYDEFVKFVKEQNAGDVLNFYFSGAIDETGKSWCPDCVKAEPHVKNAIETYLSPDQKFVYVDVGNRATWKDPKCPFRTDKDTHLQVIPTLIRWKSPQRLEGPQLESEDLLEMFFSDD